MLICRHMKVMKNLWKCKRKLPRNQGYILSIQTRKPKIFIQNLIPLNKQGVRRRDKDLSSPNLNLFFVSSCPSKSNVNQRILLYLCVIRLLDIPIQLVFSVYFDFSRCHFSAAAAAQCCKYM